MQGYGDDEYDPEIEVCEDYTPEYEEPPDDDCCEDQFFESDDDERDYSDEELQRADWVNGYDEFNEAHDPSCNPWIEEFGPGEEAETTYWNTN